MTNEQRKICLRAVDHFGAGHQIEKAKEELSELTTELSRLQDSRTSPELIRGELADVIIMCEQLRLIYGGKETDAWIDRKLERLWGMMRVPAEKEGGGEE